jgi:uncharacterized Tic20 family protein
VSNGIGGVGAALLIWLTQKQKSAYLAQQALQALVYQVVAFVVTFVAWSVWGIAWVLLILPPVIANPQAYNTAPPAGLWVGLFLMVIPLGVSAITTLYGLWGGIRCLRGEDFRYVLLGDWVARREG